MHVYLLRMLGIIMNCYGQLSENHELSYLGQSRTLGAIENATHGYYNKFLLSTCNSLYIGLPMIFLQAKCNTVALLCMMIVKVIGTFIPKPKIPSRIEIRFHCLPKQMEQCFEIQ